MADLRLHSEKLASEAPKQLISGEVIAKQTEMISKSVKSFLDTVLPKQKPVEGFSENQETNWPLYVFICFCVLILYFYVYTYY